MQEGEMNLNIVPVLSLNQMCLLYGSHDASPLYLSFRDEIKDLVEENVSLHNRMDYAVRSALLMRNNVLAMNSRLIAPVCVQALLICSFSAHQPDSIPLQIRSCFMLPIIVDEDSLPPQHEGYASSQKGYLVMFDERKYYVLDSTKSSREGAVRVILIVIGSVCDIEKPEGDDSFSCTKQEGMTLISTSKKKTMLTILSLKMLKGTTVVVHTCNDIIESNSHLYGIGVYYCTSLCKSRSNRGSLCVTDCARQILGYQEGVLVQAGDGHRGIIYKRDM